MTATKNENPTIEFFINFISRFTLNQEKAYGGHPKQIDGQR
jgi:hypothetical protein